MSKAWVAVYVVALAWSGFRPVDRFTWFLEVVPALVAFGLLFALRHRFRLTPLVAWFVLVHCVILMVGGHYTYAQVPLFEWLKEPLGLARNNYDKLGHFAQGFVPALVAREVLVRNGVVRGRRWLAFLVASVCLAVSAFYELVEWWVAAATGDSAEAFLGTQGYVWDTQSDMLMALIGAVAALALLGGSHDKQLARLKAGA